MIGKPKYKINDIVRFKLPLDDSSYVEEFGIVAIVDRYGTFFDNSDVCYGIMNKDINMLYKHVNEKLVLDKIDDYDGDVWALPNIDK